MMGAARARMRPRLTRKQVADYLDNGLLHRIDVLAVDPVAPYFPQPDPQRGLCCHASGRHVLGSRSGRRHDSLDRPDSQRATEPLLPGSHCHATRPHGETYESDNLLPCGPAILVDYDETDVVDVELRAGQMSLHYMRAIHGSQSNPFQPAKNRICHPIR